MQTKSFIKLTEVRLQKIEQSLRLLQAKRSRKAAQERRAQVQAKLRENICWAEDLLRQIS
jgi:hypothetical protein